MGSPPQLAEQFENNRPHLVALAHRILGSIDDAEDAVQVAWVRARSADTSTVENPAAWLHTVTARICFDQLRARRRRGELPLIADAFVADQVAADEAYIGREEVSRALMVVLDQLTPAQRVAFVLHDQFDVPFATIATVLDTTTASAKKLASRARGRLRNADSDRSAPADELVAHAEIVEAFLAAARGGDIERLVTMLAPEAVRTADPVLLRAGAPVEVVGDRAVAEETRTFADRIAVSTMMFIDGRPGVVVAPGGHLFATLRFEFEHRRIVRLSIARPDGALLSV